MSLCDLGDDSFFTLTLGQRIGLLGVSCGLALGMVGLVRIGRAWPIRLILAGAGFYGFVWVSPQAYYIYYRLIFDGLPAQIVVAAPPGLVELAGLLTFTAQNTLSAHSLGALGWAMLAAALWPRKDMQ